MDTIAKLTQLKKSVTVRKRKDTKSQEWKSTFCLRQKSSSSSSPSEFFFLVAQFFFLQPPLSRPISIPIVRGFFHERNPILKSGDKKCQPAANTPCRTDHGSPSGSSGKAKDGESEWPWFETD